MDSNISVSLEPGGVLLARIDMPGRAMNVFSMDMMDSLESIIVRAESDPEVRGVVLSSGKSTFLVGADLNMIRVFTERAKTGTFEQLHDLCGRLGRLFRRIETSRKPYVAAINGLALGGGLEVCLACHSRIAANDENVGLGLPEIKLGLLPGAGGTQRLPRLIGARKGLECLLHGQSLSRDEALSLGLVDELVPAAELIAAALERARTLAAPSAPWDRPTARFDSAPFDFGSERAYDEISGTLGISVYQRVRYPAYRAIMRCVVEGWSLPIDEALHHEMDIFVDLIRDRVAGNMVRTLFLNRQTAKKQGLLDSSGPLEQGDKALLPRLRAVQAGCEAMSLDEDARILAIALEAARCWGDDKVSIPALADVAVVEKGLCPAFTGGPYTFLLQSDLDALRVSAAELAGQHGAAFAWPDAADRFLADAGTVLA